MGVPRIAPNPGEDVAPHLRALITEIPGPAWTEFCNLLNENVDTRLLLGRKEVEIARLQREVQLYKECHEGCVRLLNYLDPPSDL